jgi:glycosyltransferase involved in cell wall biosynthesis
MRVLICPDFRATNPYQQLLATAVSHQNITVLWGKHGRFTLLKSLRYKPDLIHLHWTAPFWLDGHPLRSRVAALRFLAELLEAKRRGVKLVWTAHNLHDHERTNPRLEHAVNRWLCRLVDRVLVHCAAAETAVLQTYRLPAAFRRHITVTGHGNFIGVYENGVSRAKARRRFSLPAEAPVFLFFGQIRPYKGVPALLDAFRRLEMAAAHLLIAGRPADAALAASLREASREHPRIGLHLRFIPDAAIQHFMNAADVVVLPFRDISTSSTVILAMSFGKAIVAPPFGCLPQILDERGCCFYDPGEEGLAEALRQVRMADWGRMGRHNLALARRLDWDEIGRRTAEVYRRL